MRFVRIRTRLSRALRFFRLAQGHIECQFWSSWEALTSSISWRTRSVAIAGTRCDSFRNCPSRSHQPEPEKTVSLEPQKQCGERMGKQGTVFREQILSYCEAGTRSWFFVSQEPSLETKTEAIFQRTRCGGPSGANDCCHSKDGRRPLALEKCQAGRSDRSKVTMYLPQSPNPDPSTSIAVPPSTPSYSTIMN